MIAPFYADSDVRVRRSIDVLQEMGFRLLVFWDEPHHRHVGRYANGDRDVEEAYVPHPAFFRSLLGRQGLSEPVANAVRAADFVYIHASGIYGLVLAREVRGDNPRCRIVFDYRDSLAFELDYQLRKRRVGFLFRPMSGAYPFIIRRLLRAVDAVVGISERQLADLEAQSEGVLRKAVVPNLRAFDADIDRNGVAGADGAAVPISFAWIGQVMSGRDLLRVARWVSRLERGHRLDVVGTVLSSALELAVRAELGERVSFHGGYGDDAEIANKMPPRTIGVFLGWDDPQGTGINRIASPNKYFTYINLGFPVIVDRRVEPLAAELEEWGAGIAVNDEGEFRAAARAMQHSYESYADRMTLLKEHYARLDPRKPLQDLVASLLSG